MFYPSYVVSALTGRVRLRHPILATEEGLRKALEVLSREKEIFAKTPTERTGSLLLQFEPHFELAPVLAALEEALPELKGEKELAVKHKKTIFGLSERKLESRLLLILLACGTLSACMGSERAHVATTSGFLALVLRHLWVHRRAL
ncbi:MAG: hypothetical protein IJS50_04365 [Desulfovibrio sp.]|nr:hypothetical protein [Desulfovibrio sp.]